MKHLHRIIEFNQNALLKLYIDMNIDLWKKAKNDFQRYFIKFINNRNEKKKEKKNRDTYEHRPFPLQKIMKDELGGKIMTRCFRLRVKTYSHLTDDGSEDKKKQKPQKRVS